MPQVSAQRLQQTVLGCSVCISHKTGSLGENCTVFPIYMSLFLQIAEGL